ncbi:hypothetical protein [Haloferax volcanii]|uniref:hypothetical protein n=1 Tax=Haloferax volcanii TaxID=2246 RepID=UPI00349F2624
MSEDVIVLLDDVRDKYDCDSYAEAVEEAADTALRHDSDSQLVYEILEVLSEYSDDPAIDGALSMLERRMD